MKIIFANAPVVRYKTNNPKGDWRVFMAQCCIPFYRGPFRYFLQKTLLNGMRFGVRAGSRWPWTLDAPLVGSAHYPFFMGYSAALLRSKGFNATIIDYIALNNISYQSFIEELKAEQADIIVLECSTPTVDIDIWMAEQISKFSDVALAGPHITDNYQQMAQDYPFVKYWLKGEYIQSSLTMATTLRGGIYEAEVVTDLDAIPFPFRDYKGGHSYYDPTMPTAKPQLQIYASKGCPFHCTFCLWPQTMYNHTVAMRQPEKVIEEIKENVIRFGYKSIFFDDDTFNVGEERINNLCDGLKKLKLPWTWMGRLDCSSREMFDKMVDCGCVGMRLGVESFDHDVLKQIKKGIERVDFLKTLTYLAEKYPEVMLHVTMMRDMPGQSEEIHQRDMRIISDLGFSEHNTYRNYQLSRCAPFPGTEMYNDLMKSGYKQRLQNFAEYDGGQDTVMKDIR
jgi:radical SAM superfamily enzyme YgiQ (UPF0313 family)